MAADGADGGLPVGNLLLADGALYGTTGAGGTGPCTQPGNPIIGCGTVFKLVGHKETVLHSFQGPDGRGPGSNVVRDTEGNFYGTTGAGGDGTCNGDFGCGVVFKLAPDGKETLIHTFEDQNSPEGMVMDPKGVIYGSVSGQASAGYVFQVDSSGQYSVLYTINAQGVGGPGDLILDDQGNLYGSGISVVFKLTP